MRKLVLTLFIAIFCVFNVSAANTDDGSCDLPNGCMDSKSFKL